MLRSIVLGSLVAAAACGAGPRPYAGPPCIVDAHDRRRPVVPDDPRAERVDRAPAPPLKRAPQPSIEALCDAARACLDARPPPPDEPIESDGSEYLAAHLLDGPHTRDTCTEAWELAAAHLEHLIGREAMPATCPPRSPPPPARSDGPPIDPFGALINEAGSS